jgi:L,D-peptidoglycan transpeptidase YkuD (ErfK/YbiS/YcfS/YnhG family)
VKRLIADTSARTLQAGDAVLSCAIGRSGACDAHEKREGDGYTPRGTWPVRAALLRPDRGIAPLMLPWRWLRPDDGWSDDPRDLRYNRAARHPHPFSAERLWRDDGLYDAILILGHNDSPAVPGAGSAIFLHLREGDATEGCIAIDRAAMSDLLAHLEAGAEIAIL